jgi:enoyl-CoA hydratase
LVPDGESRAAAEGLAEQIAGFPERCTCSDRLSAYEQMAMSLEEAIANEFDRGLQVIQSGETREGATRFAAGAGRHGSFD